MHGRGKKLSKPKTHTQKTKSEENIVKSIRNFFKLKKENEVAKNIIIKYIRTLFEQEYNYYEPTRVGNFWNNTCIKYDGDGNKNVSVKEYLNKIKPYLRDMIIDLQKSDLSKV